MKTNKKYVKRRKKAWAARGRALRSLWHRALCSYWYLHCPNTTAYFSPALYQACQPFFVLYKADNHSPTQTRLRLPAHGVNPPLTITIVEDPTLKGNHWRFPTE